jgi:hypothetical protein
MRELVTPQGHPSAAAKSGSPYVRTAETTRDAAIAVDLRIAQSIIRTPKVGQDALSRNRPLPDTAAGDRAPALRAREAVALSGEGAAIACASDRAFPGRAPWGRELSQALLVRRYHLHRNPETLDAPGEVAAEPLGDPFGQR